MTDHEIAALCDTHGAKRVSDAAYAAMRGDYSRCDALGITTRGIGPLHKITVIAYKLMDPEDQALDLAQASIDAAKLP